MAKSVLELTKKFGVIKSKSLKLKQTFGTNKKIWEWEEKIFGISLNSRKLNFNQDP